MSVVKYNWDIYITLLCIKEAGENPPLTKRIIVKNKTEVIERLVEKSTKEYLKDRLGLKDTTINERISYLASVNLIELKDMYKAIRALKLIYRLTDYGKRWLKTNKGVHDN